MRHNHNGTAVLMAILFFCLCASAWLTHIVDCLVKGLYVLLLVGAVVFPIGIFHGMGVWFGVWA
jgi:hypothetical protein